MVADYAYVGIGDLGGFFSIQCGKCVTFEIFTGICMYGYRS